MKNFKRYFLLITLFICLLSPQITNAYDFPNDARKNRAENIRKNIYSLYDMYKDILGEDEANNSSQFGVTNYNGVCTNVTVDGTTIPMETYIAGVVKAEIGSEFDNPEVLKAQALLARSFLLRSKGNSSSCSVVNGQSFQAYSKIDPNSSRDKLFMAAANATAGQVVTRNGKIALTQYQSYPAGQFQKEDGNGWHVQFQRFADDESTKWTWNGPAKEYVRSVNNYRGTEMDYNNSHNWGMSQTIAGYLTRKEGYKYTDVIKLFYNEPITVLSDGRYDDRISYVNSSFGQVRYWNQRDFLEYYSTDPNNINQYGGATIKSHGCGPTSIAIIASSMLGRNISPIETTAKLCARGGCSSGGSYNQSLADSMRLDYGLNVTTTTNDQVVINALATKNALVIAHMGPGTFTSGGHYIVLTGVTSDGMVSVADPNSRELTQQLFPFNTIIEEKRAQYIIVQR